MLSLEITIRTSEHVTLSEALHVLRTSNTQPYTDDCCQQVNSRMTT